MRKKRLLIPFIIISTFISSFLFIPTLFSIQPEIKDVRLVKIMEKDGKTAAYIEITLFNKKNINAYLESSKIYLKNQKGKFAYLDIKDVNIPSLSDFTIYVFAYFIEGEALNKFLSEIFSQSYSEFKYEGAAKVFPSFLPLFPITINIQGSSIFKMKEIGLSYSIKKILIKENKRILNLQINNSLNNDIIIQKIYSEIYFLNKKIGNLIYDKEVKLFSNFSQNLNINFEINNENFLLLIDYLINNKSVEIISKINLNAKIFSTQINLKFDLKEKLNFDLNFFPKIKKYEINNITNINILTDIYFSFLDKIFFDFELKNLSFDFYIKNSKIGVGKNLNIGKIINNNLTDFILNLKLKREKVSLFIKEFLENKIIKSEISNLNISIKIFQKEFNFKLKEKFKINLNNTGFDIEGNSSVISFYVNNNFLIANFNLTLYSNLLDEFEFEIEKANVRILVDNSTFKIEIENESLKIGSSSFVTVKFDIYENNISKIFGLFLTKKSIIFKVIEFNGSIKIFENKINIKIKPNFTFNLASPIIFNLKITSGKIISTDHTIAYSVNITLKIKAEFEGKIEIKKIIFDLFSENLTYLISKNVIINTPFFITGPEEREFKLKAILDIPRESYKWLSDQILLKGILTLIAKDIKIEIKIQNYYLNIKINKIAISTEIIPVVNINILEINFKELNKAEINALVNIPEFPYLEKIRYISLTLKDILTNETISNITSKKIISASKSQINLKAEITFIKPDSLTDLGKILIGKEVSFLATDFILRILDNSQEKQIILSKLVFIKIKGNFDIIVNINITEYEIKNLEGPAIIASGNFFVEISEKVKGNFKIKEVNFKILYIYKSKEIDAGNGYFIFKEPASFKRKGNFTFVTQIYLTNQGFASIASEIFTKKILIFKIVNIETNIEINQLKGKVPFKNLTIEIKSKYKLPLIISAIKITHLSFSPPAAKAVVTISISNPFDFSITIFSTKLDIKDFKSNKKIGYASLSKTYTLNANEKKVISNIPVTITSEGIRVISKYYNPLTGCVKFRAFGEGYVPISAFNIQFSTYIKTSSVPITYCL